jgi:hypothetical protein
MFFIRKILVILCCFLILVTNNSKAEEINKVTSKETTKETSKIRTALVNVIEAIVYSDPSLKNPIGIVPRGTYISIGGKLIKSPSVVPVVVDGRVGYIKLSDLYLDEDQQFIINGRKVKSIYHDPNYLDPRHDENLFLNNTVNVSLHKLFTGQEVKSLFQNIDGTDQSTMTVFGADYIHRHSQSRLIWGIGMEYLWATSENVKYSFLVLKPIIGHTIIKNPLLFLDLFATFTFSIDSTLIIKSNAKDNAAGFLFGTDLGARAVFFPEGKYHPTASIAFSSYKVRDVPNYSDSQDNTYPAVESIKGINLAIGISIDL